MAGEPEAATVDLVRRRSLRPVLAVVAIYVVLIGPIVGMVWWALRGLGEGITASFSKEFSKALEDAFPFVPDERVPDLEVAPGAPGYIDFLRTAGQQLHFYDKEEDRTTVAGLAWFGGNRARLAVADYDGPPSREWGPRSARPRSAYLAVLVLRVVDAEGRRRERAAVWCESKEKMPLFPVGSAWCDAGEVNLVLLPGVLTLWADDGPRGEITLADHEIAWCTLGPKGLVVEERETRR
jgi:hypothetical protein